MANLISREPWWFLPPKPGQDEMTCVWGYLEHYDDGGFVFVHERPSDEEIANRKGCRLASRDATQGVLE